VMILAIAASIMATRQGWARHRFFITSFTLLLCQMLPFVGQTRLRTFALTEERAHGQLVSRLQGSSHSSHRMDAAAIRARHGRRHELCHRR
jgi:hypothetical protein